MNNFSTIAELLALARKHQVPLSTIVQQVEADSSGLTARQIWNNMAENLQVMKEAVATGLTNPEKSFSGLVGGDAYRLSRHLTREGCLNGQTTIRAAAYALAVSEVNAGMGRIVACPTAGSCGILPGAVLAVAEQLGKTDDDLIRALFTAAGIGMVIAGNASIAGATGGCQAECGSAAAMAAGAVVELAGGTPPQSVEALALALKSSLGLVCDPVAGLVEVPCVKRNAFGAVQALTAAELALAGITSVIPADEVIGAMRQIGLALPRSLRETSEGGLAQTPTALRIADRLAAKAQP